jgi:hypothetical protein
MDGKNIVLAECTHGGGAWYARDCPACGGSGYVKVLTGPDGQPRRCTHGGGAWYARDCKACGGSGWAGMV